MNALTILRSTTAICRARQRTEDRALMELMAGPNVRWQTFWGATIPIAGAAAPLRRAFDAAVPDSDFRAEAARLPADIAPNAAGNVHSRYIPRPIAMGDRTREKLLAP